MLLNFKLCLGSPFRIQSFIYINIFYFSCMCAPVLLTLPQRSFLAAYPSMCAMCDFIYFRLPAKSAPVPFHLSISQVQLLQKPIKISRMRIQICAAAGATRISQIRPGLGQV